jgi:hypothetical protein
MLGLPLFLMCRFEQWTYNDFQLAGLRIVPNIDGRIGKRKEVYLKVLALG